MICHARFLLILTLFLAMPLALTAQNAPVMPDTADSDNLLIVWTSADREVALNMVFMYAHNAKLRGWWGNVQLLVWGPSSNLLAQDAELQEYVQKMRDAGVILTACKACADSYGVSDTLQELEIDVKYMGVPLTELLKDERWRVITF